MIGPLTDPRSHGGDPAGAYHLVLPSIPGFGFSGPVPDAGWGLPRIAGAWAELMRRLGYHRYVAQGGDIGAGLSLTVAAMDGEHVLGAHVNLLITPPPDDPAELGAAGVGPAGPAVPVRRRRLRLHEAAGHPAADRVLRR